MKNFLLAPLLIASFGATAGFAGGRPVMFVVVDRVETTQDDSSISMIRIWGSFSRAEHTTSGGFGDFGKPIFGYIQFGRGSDKEAPKWRKAAGTGKAVNVGYCGGAGAFETVRIHPADEKPKDLGDNLPYPAGHIELFGPGKTGDLFAGGQFDAWTEVKTLLVFASTKGKRSGPSGEGAASTVLKKTSPQQVDNAWVGKWTVEFANGVIESCDLDKDGKANVVEARRSTSGKVRQTTNDVLELVFDDDRIERWAKIGQRIVVEHWPSADQFPGQPPVLGIGEKRKRRGE
jgi:hypothetical protein